MKNNYKIILILGFFLFYSSIVLAEPPIRIKHSVDNYLLDTAYDTDTTYVMVDISVYIENTGETPLYDLTVSTIPLQIIVEGNITIKKSMLAAHSSMETSFDFITPMFLTQEEFNEQPIFWAGEYRDVKNNIVKFSVISYQTAFIE